jgi:hypothetical protein
LWSRRLYLFKRSRQAMYQACAVSGGLAGGSGIGGLFILVVLNLYRTRLRIDYLQELKVQPNHFPNQDVRAKCNRKVRGFTCRLFLLQFWTVQGIRQGRKPPAGGSSKAIPEQGTTCTLNVQQKRLQYLAARFRFPCHSYSSKQPLN